MNDLGLVENPVVTRGGKRQGLTYNVFYFHHIIKLYDRFCSGKDFYLALQIALKLFWLKLENMSGLWTKLEKGC